MNFRLVIFSGLLTAMVGAVLGIAAAEICNYKSNQIAYSIQEKQLDPIYIVVGAAMGAIVGAGQETVRELKQIYEEDMENDLENASYQ